MKSASGVILKEGEYDGNLVGIVAYPDSNAYLAEFLVNGIHVFAWLPYFKLEVKLVEKEGTLRNHILVKGIVS